MIEALQEVLEDVQGKTRLKERYVNREDVNVSQIRQKYQLTQRKPHGSALVLLKVVDKALHH